MILSICKTIIRSRASITVMTLLALQKVMQAFGYMQGIFPITESLDIIDFCGLPFAVFLLLPLFLTYCIKLTELLFNPAQIMRYGQFPRVLFTYLYASFCLACVFILYNFVTGYMALCLVTGRFVTISILSALFSFCCQTTVLLIMNSLYLLSKNLFMYSVMAFFPVILYSSWDYIVAFLPSALTNHLFFGWYISIMAYSGLDSLVIFLFIRELSILLLFISLLYIQIERYGFEKFFMEMN